jgi:hypothetical protein
LSNISGAGKSRIGVAAQAFEKNAATISKSKTLSQLIENMLSEQRRLAFEIQFTHRKTSRAG